MRPGIRYLADAYQFGRSLVLVQGASDPDYDSAMVYNPLDLSANAPIYVWDRDPATRQKLVAAYPDRLIWIVKGPTLTQRGYEVVAGPIESGKLLEDANRRSEGTE
jgi:hypothetical protein